MELWVKKKGDRTGLGRIIGFLVLWLFLGSSGHAQEKSSIVRVRIETELGSMVAEVYSNRAPITAANFLRYVDSSYYNGGSFYRTVRPDNQPSSPVKIEVIQGDIHPWQSNFSFPPIALERTNLTGLKHRNGALSMARGSPDTATSSFFICVGDQPELDFGGKRNPDGQGFAAFGQIVEGMETVHRIHQSHSEGQALMLPVRILRIVRI